MPTATAAAPAFGPAERHASTIRNGIRMANKFRRNQQLAEAVHDYLLTTYDVRLPADRKAFKADKDRILHADAYAVDGDNPLETECQHLIRLYYALRISRGYFAEFGTAENHRIVPLAFMYSKNRLDYAWNMRKSQLVRNRYFNYLQDARDAHGRLLTTHYRPIHLVLTVPHKGGLWHGQRFYARQLIKLFAELRKSAAWKDYIYAGEYGLEVKRSKRGHGLHIHVHSFLLQHPEYSLNEVREALTAEWRLLTGNTSGYSGLHYETLYTRVIDPATGLKTKKRYVIPGVSPLQEYLSGVLECIKYHFKPDCLDTEGDGYDVPLIKEILENTHNLRMYSRFGAFYKQPALNFNKLHEDGPALDELSETEVEEEVKASVEGVEERLIDPRTWEPAAPGSYRIKAGHPLALRYYAKSGDRPNEPYYLPQATPALLEAPPGLTLKQTIKLDVKGALERLCYLARNTTKPDDLANIIGWLTGESGGNRPT